MTGLIIALDTADLGQAAAWAMETEASADMFKIGLELFIANGPVVMAAVHWGKPVMLDLKLHDIPRTVAAAIEVMTHFDPLPAIITVDGFAGLTAIAAAIATLGKMDHSVRPKLLSVSILSTMTDQDLAALNITDSQAPKMASMAMALGIAGLVVKASDVREMRESFPEAILAVPGVRLPGAEADDQIHIGTPAQVAQDGADWAIVGSPITGSDDPAAAAATFKAALSEGAALPGSADVIIAAESAPLESDDASMI